MACVGAAVGGARLGIERFELAWSPTHEHQDARQAAASQFLGLLSNRILPAEHSHRGGAAGHAGEEGAPADDAVCVGSHLHESMSIHGVLHVVV